MALHPLPAPTAPAPGGEAAWECHPALRATTGGLTYVQMMALAEAANLRGTLEQIGEQIAGLFAAVLERAPTLRALTS